MGNGIELLQHSICLILSILLVQIATHNQFNQDATKGQICYPNTSMAKYWKLNKRFMVKEEFFDKNIPFGNVPNIQCFKDRLDLFRCFWVENVNEEFLKEGAFLEDHVPMPPTTTEISTSQSTILTTTSSSPTTPISTDRIQCDGPKWAIVKPALFYVKRNGRRITADKAIRAGFIDYIYIEKNPPFSEKHINETIMEMIKNSTSLFESNNEVNKWIEDNGGWLQNIKHGYFQYVPLDSKFDDAKLVVAMLLYNCSFGDFILAPAEFNDNFEMAHKTFDWEEDFEFLDKCIERQEDISKNLDRTYYIGSIIKSKNLEIVNFEVGTSIMLGLNLAKCEAFKYKYGYTYPLRSAALAESSNDWERDSKTGLNFIYIKKLNIGLEKIMEKITFLINSDIKSERMGALVLPIENSCRSLYGMKMTAEFFKIAKQYLMTFGLLRRKKDCVSDADDDCLECLSMENVDPDDDDYYEQTCEPLMTCSVIQTIYDCGDEFFVRIPRVMGRQNFTMNGTNYLLDNTANSYELANRDYYKKMCSHGMLSDYILYDNDADSC